MGRRTKASATRGFGHPDDDPLDLLQSAEDDLRDAATGKRLTRMRRAASIAALALDSAVERAAGRALTSDRARAQALGAIGRAVDRSLPKKVENIRRVFHRDCYHQKKCDLHDLLVKVGEARELVDRILQARGRVR